jgi:hypothetical protein
MHRRQPREQREDAGHRAEVAAPDALALAVQVSDRNGGDGRSAEALATRRLEEERRAARKHAYAKASDPSGIVTTPDEIEAHRHVIECLAGIVPAERVQLVDRKSYCNIALDGDPRRAVVRLRFTDYVLKVGLFDTPTEDQVEIAKVEDIRRLTDRIQASARGRLEQ